MDLKQYVIRLAEDGKPFFSYGDFSNVDNLNLIENASIYNKAIRLTRNSTNERGAVWHNKLLPLQKGFTTNFTFKISKPDENLNGADGLAFVIQNTSPFQIGEVGGGLGYKGIKNGIAIEFDLYDNNNQEIINYNDSNDNHLSLIIPKDSMLTAEHSTNNTLLLNPNIVRVMPDSLYHVKIEYIEHIKSLKVYLSKDSTLTDPPALISNEFDLKDYIAFSNQSSYVGITASTGSSYQNHFIMNWSMCPIPGSSDPDDASEGYINDNVLLYPNPAVSYVDLTIGSNPNGQVYTYEIYNNFGNKVKAGNLIFNYSQSTIDIHDISSGYYTLILKHRNIIIKPLIITR